MSASGRIQALAAAGLVAVIAAGGFFLGVQPQLARAATAETTAADTDAQTASARVRLAGLAKVAARQSELEARETVLSKAVPTGLQVNTFYRRMNELAALDGVTVDTVTQGAAVAYTAPSAAAAAAATSTATATPAPTASATAAATTAPAPTAPLLAATDPLITGTSLTVVPTSVRVVGTADATMQFVKDVQGDERLFLVSGVDVETDSATGTSTTTLTGSVYVLQG